MKAFAMFLRATGRRIVVAGSGAQTAQGTQLEQMLLPNIGRLVAMARRLHQPVKPRMLDRAHWTWMLKGWLRNARTPEADHNTAGAIEASVELGTQAQGAATGQICLVGAGPGARDLLTLRAVERLQDADVIFYDRLVDEEVLELTRPDAERIFVGKHVGAHSCPQDRINQMIVEEAYQGKRVVRLKSGDPGVFGRATEEIDAAHAAGIRVEIVPGVTAAMAAAATLGKSLTCRDVADVLVLATGTGCKNDPSPDTTRLTGPGTTTAIYMGVRHAARLETDLLKRGLPADAAVGIAVEVSKPGQKHIETTLSSLADTIKNNRIRGCAVIMVTWPKQM